LTLYDWEIGPLIINSSVQLDTGSDPSRCSEKQGISSESSLALISDDLEVNGTRRVTGQNE